MTLGEVSPTDRFYGIGKSLHASEEELANIANWGSNLLAELLMRVPFDYIS